MNSLNPLTKWAYAHVAKHQRKYETKTRRNIDYRTFIAKINLLTPLYNALPNTPRFKNWHIKIGRGNRITLENHFLLIEPFMDDFVKWNPFIAILSVMNNGDFTLDDIRFKPALSDWLADNEPQLWTLLLDALYQDE